uniref:PiggyBac transposable element-derived protein domain-containing protein n=1 Tax=Neogobius melanostomus TaxID=47308 RepID=A0A8C6U166_9GOBI
KTGISCFYKKRQRLAWETVEPQNSEKAIPTWQSTLFDLDLTNSIVEQSNLYCRQQNPNSALKLDQKELEQFIGTVVYMSISHLPRSRMYWSSACRFPQVADVMSRDRWEELKRFIHFNDNMAPNNDDRLFKIRPLIDSLLPKFQALPQDQMLCVDEQMVPFKGRSSLKQYNPKKPYKWGYKIFMLCDTKGLVHSFEIFAGKIDPVPGQPDIGASGDVVLKLAQVIHPNINHLLYFDSWFSSLNLFVALAKMGIPALGTVEKKHLQGCSFSEDSDMKKKGRGVFEEQEVVVDGVEMRAVKWFDHRGVIVASSLPVKMKRNVFVKRPSIIALYRKCMGGVDALDALIAQYRIHIRSKKYYHRLFFHFVDMVIVNSWLLYRRDCVALCVPKKKERQRCKLPLCKGHTVFKCEKCNVHLCLNKHNNCFRLFHT